MIQVKPALVINMMPEQSFKALGHCLCSEESKLGFCLYQTIHCSTLEL